MFLIFILEDFRDAYCVAGGAFGRIWPSLPLRRVHVSDATTSFQDHMGPARRTMQTFV